MEIRRAPRFAASGVAFALVLLAAVGTLWPAYRARQHWAVAVGVETREQYLERAEPTYRAALLANILTESGAKILSQDNRGFYFDAEVTQESLYRRRTRYDAASGDLATQLRRDGFSYLLLADATGGGIQYDDTLSELAQQTLALPQQHDFRSITSYRFRDADGAERTYRLVRVEPGFVAGETAVRR